MFSFIPVNTIGEMCALCRHEETFQDLAETYGKILQYLKSMHGKQFTDDVKDKGTGRPTGGIRLNH